MVRVAAEGLGHDLVELGLDFLGIFAGRQFRAVADSKYVRVDCEGLLAKCGVEHHVRGFPADAGERLKLLARAWNLAAVLVDQRLTERDHVLRLGVEQPDCLDRLAQPLLTQRDHLLGRFHMLEQGLGRDVDARVCRLRGEDNRNEQSVGIGIVELCRGRRIILREPAEEFEHLLALHRSSSSAAARRFRASANSSVGMPNPTRKWLTDSNQRPGTTAAS